MRRHKKRQKEKSPLASIKAASVLRSSKRFVRTFSPFVSTLVGVLRLRVKATIQLPNHRPGARLYLGPHVLPEVRGEGLVHGRADDVDGDEEREEHDVHEDGIHHAHVHTLLLEEANLHHQHEKERGQRAELAGDHEQEELLRVEGRAPHEQDEEEAADEHLRKELPVATRSNEGGHGHEAGLARHLEELVVPG